MLNRLDKRILRTIIGAAALLLAAHSASAATVSASASFDWSNLSISFAPSSIGYTLTNEFSTTSVFGTAGNDSNFSTDWTTAILASVNSGNVIASANANAGVLGTSVNITGGAPFALEYGYSQRAALIRITGGPGQLLISVPAISSISIGNWSATDASASAAASSYLLARSRNNLYSTSFVSLTGCDTCEVTDASETGLLTLTLAVSAGDLVKLQAETYVYSELTTRPIVPIPLPPSVLLLSSALLGLGMLRRAA